MTKKIQSSEFRVQNSKLNKTSSTRSTSSGSRPAASMAELMAKAGSNLHILQKGQTVEGTIKKLTPGEILMDIGAKGDALVIEYDRQNLENLLSFLKVGDRVSASVISAESEEGFPVVSLRRALDDIIFSRFEKLNKNDEAFEVEVTDQARGGYFAETFEGVSGFLPISQLKGEGGDYLGKKIKVKILEFDRSKKRIIFSEKALSYTMNPDELRRIFKPKERVEGIITTVTPYGLFVSLGKDGIQAEGFVHISEISYERVENLGERYKKGDKIKAEVNEIDSMNKRVNLSIKKTTEDLFKNIKDKYKVDDRVKGAVKDIKTRGITIELSPGINGFITQDKIPTGKEYEVGEAIEALVTGFDERRRVILLSPVLKAVPIGYR